MAESFQKKESIKKNALRKKIKDQKKQERKLNNNKGKGLDSMIAAVDDINAFSTAPAERLLIRKATAE
ncbi:hypothetical protein [Flavobacterium sp. MK4S-17]|uniref:hypothetical protein n=1 Tax=Flavobacterium sp. MK4S-17 TaxID=2543737 RepID=UPI001358DACB|nr:hypothetical protein [Flavobacterium sp. MK4S-17]